MSRDPEHMIENATRNRWVPADIALRAVRRARTEHLARLDRDGDRPVATLGPDARLVLDASLCIVLITTGSRITIGHVTRWQDALDQAKTFQAIYSDDADQARTADRIERDRMLHRARRALVQARHPGYAAAVGPARGTLAAAFLDSWRGSETQLSIEEYACHWGAQAEVTNGG